MMEKTEFGGLEEGTEGTILCRAAGGELESCSWRKKFN
jgi:hypothetical protein